MSSRLSLLLPCALAACGGVDAEYARLVKEHGIAMVALRQAEDDHRASMAAASDPGAVAGIERAYQDRMRAAMGGMGSTLERMGACACACGADGARMMGGLENEMAQHATRMGAAADMGAMRAEESRHAGAFASHMAAMEGDHTHMRSMMEMGMGMDCPR